MEVRDSYIDAYSRQTPRQVRQEVELFVGSGNLRSALEKSGELNEDEINYLIGLLRIAIQR